MTRPDLLFRAPGPSAPPWPHEQVWIDSTWLTNFAASNDSGPWPRDLKRGMADVFLHRLRSRPSFRWAVCARAAEPELAVGFVAWELPGHHRHSVTVRHPERHGWTTNELRVCQRPTLFYVYVRAGHRHDPKVPAAQRPRVATALLAHAGIDPRQPFCFPFRTLEMRSLVDGPRGAPRASGPWRGGKYDPRTHQFPDAEKASPEEQPE